MDASFARFKELFENRYNRVSVLDLGEDSVRYDFFTAVKEGLNLEPWEIQVEHPIHKEAFEPRQNEKRKRDEKPQMDLWIENSNHKIGVEFAIFKRNKVDNSPINETEYVFKLLNDFMRLALHSFLTNSKAYFVCVADGMMLGKQLYTRKIPSFPGQAYDFDHLRLIEIMGEYVSARKIDQRFLSRLQKHGLTVNAKLIFNEKFESQMNPLETRALIWEVTVKKS